MATTIRVAAAQRPPYVFVNNQLSGPAAYSGLLVQLLPVLLQTANITAPFEVYTAPDNEGGSYSDGAYTGKPSRQCSPSQARCSRRILLSDCRG